MNNKILYQIKLITPFWLRRIILNTMEGNIMREEDLILKFFKKKFRQQETRLTLIDVGAAAGSFSLLYSKKGWKVFAVEPDDENRARLLNNIRVYHCDIDVDTHAISDVETKMPFYTSDVSAGIKGLNQFHASHRMYKEVDTITLTTFCKQKNIGDFNFLKIDTEGYDLNVLKGMDFKLHQVEVIMCEYDDNKTARLGYHLADMTNYLKENGFIPIISEWYHLTEYGKGHKWKRFTTNINEVDPNSWGNIIAVKPNLFDSMATILKINK
jgi:FkbM family methyltransferase